MFGSHCLRHDSTHVCVYERVLYFFYFVITIHKFLYFHALHCIKALKNRQVFVGMLAILSIIHFLFFRPQHTVYYMLKILNIYIFYFVIVCNAVWTNYATISKKSVMRAQESSSNHVNTSPSSSQETDLEWAHPRPPGPGRKWEEEEEREVAGSQRETEWGEIGRGTAHHARSKTKVMHRCSQNKHISGGAFSKSCCL